MQQRLLGVVAAVGHSAQTATVQQWLFVNISDCTPIAEQCLQGMLHGPCLGSCINGNTATEHDH